MRGADVRQLGMFSYVSVEERVPADHPIRKLRVLVDGILKEKEAKLSHLADALMENRNGLLAGIDVCHASGTGERDGALAFVDIHLRVCATLGADKGYDTYVFAAALKRRGIHPHIARHTNGRRGAIDGRSARSNGYAMSQWVRKRIEQGFGWVETIGGLRKLPLIGLDAVRG